MKITSLIRLKAKDVAHEHLSQVCWKTGIHPSNRSFLPQLASCVAIRDIREANSSFFVMDRFARKKL